MTQLAAPFAGLPPEEVPLANAPLARVICQIRFAPVLALGQASGIVGFQEALRKHYPVLSEDRQQHVLMAQHGALAVRDEIVWRFSDRARTWRVSLATDFVALETTAYVSRADFGKRFAQVLRALEQYGAPQEVMRIGMRYINRMAGESADDAVALFAPGALGVYQSAYSGITEHLVSEIGFRCEEGRVVARTAYLPAGATPDPGAIEPIEEDCWILDLDVFSTETGPFDARALAETASALAGRAYAVFRTMVTDVFLERFGGTAEARQ